MHVEGWNHSTINNSTLTVSMARGQLDAHNSLKGDKQVDTTEE